MATDVALQIDVPCARCGYDLRGLTPPARCPECGFDIDESIRVSRRTVVPAEARWLRSMIAGTSIALLGFLLAAVTACFAREFNPGTSLLYFVVMVTVWVLALYGAYEVARLERLEKPRRSCRRARVALLVSALAFVVLAVACQSPLQRHVDSRWFRVLVPLFAIAASAAFYWRLRQIAFRIGHSPLAGQATMIALLSPAIPWTLRFTNLFYYSPLLGWTGFLLYLRSIDSIDDLDDWWRILGWPMMLTVCQIAVVVQLLIALVRARRRAAME